MQLKIKPSYHFRVLSHELQGVVMLLIVLFFFKFASYMLVICGIWFALNTIPVIYLHLEYYLANRGQRITIENGQLTLITRNGICKEYKFSELDKVILYKSASIDKGGIPITPMELYHFARIYTKSNEQIIITCLMCPKVEDAIDKLIGVQRLRKKVFSTLLWK